MAKYSPNFLTCFTLTIPVNVNIYTNRAKLSSSIKVFI